MNDKKKKTLEAIRKLRARQKADRIKRQALPDKADEIILTNLQALKSVKAKP